MIKSTQNSKKNNSGAILLVNLDNEDQMKTSMPKVEQDNIVYIINNEKKTADIISFCNKIEKIITIPMMINYKGKEYIVTNILKRAFQRAPIQSLKFSLESKLQTIERESFNYSSIESITIPSQFSEFKEGWCFRTKSLTKINVSPSNPYFKLYENNIIIGKTSIEKTNFDCLVFCARDVQTITIPDFIEKICSYSFEGCKQLKKIDFKNASKLRIIDTNAFRGTMPEYISIPSQVTEIRKHSFFCCSELKQLEIQSDTKLQIIGVEAFSNSQIKKIIIPSQLKIIDESAFAYCILLNKIIIPEDSKLLIIDKFAFFESSISSISIPSKVSHIGICAFNNCCDLIIIEIAFNSIIKTITISSFDVRNQPFIMIPTNLKIRFTK